MSLTISTKINGQPVNATAEASTSLLEFLRDTLEFKGTKLCCNTGECGACTIIYNGKPINSCVTMAADAIGAEILTIEGLADGDKLHPVQQAFIDTGAVQCGYCTPGFIMLAECNRPCRWSPFYETRAGYLSSRRSPRTGCAERLAPANHAATGRHAYIKAFDMRARHTLRHWRRHPDVQRNAERNGFDP